MRDIKRKLEKFESKTTIQDKVNTGIVLMLKDGGFKYGGEIYQREAALPPTQSQLGCVFLPERDIDG